LGSYDQGTYGTILVLAFFLSMGVAVFMARSAGRKDLTGPIVDMALFSIFGGLIGARLWHVFVFNWDYYSNNLTEIFKVWHGGLSIQGGLVGGLLVAIFYCYRKKISFWLMADVCAPALVLGQGIGRYANLLNGDGLARPTGGDFGIVYPPETNAFSRYGDQPLWPAETWEGQIDIVIFALLLILRLRKWPSGFIFLFYVIMYSMNRFCIDFLRGDTPQVGMLSAAQWTAVACAVIALIFLAIRHKAPRILGFGDHEGSDKPDDDPDNKPDRNNRKRKDEDQDQGGGKGVEKGEKQSLEKDSGKNKNKVKDNGKGKGKGVAERESEADLADDGLATVAPKAGFFPVEPLPGVVPKAEGLSVPENIVSVSEKVLPVVDDISTEDDAWDAWLNDEAVMRAGEKTDNTVQEAQKQEAQKQEAQRQEAQKQEAQKQEAQRQETQKQEAQKQEAQRQEAQKQEAQKQEAQKQEAQRQETLRLAAQKQEEQRLAAQKQEAQKIEAQRQEALRLAAQKQEVERLAVQKQKALQQEEAQKQAQKQETVSVKASGSKWELLNTGIKDAEGERLLSDADVKAKENMAGNSAGGVGKASQEKTKTADVLVDVPFDVPYTDRPRSLMDNNMKPTSADEGKAKDFVSKAKESFNKAKESAGKAKESVSKESVSKEFAGNVKESAGNVKKPLSNNVSNKAKEPVRESASNTKVVEAPMPIEIPPHVDIPVHRDSFNNH